MNNQVIEIDVDVLQNLLSKVDALTGMVEQLMIKTTPIDIPKNKLMTIRVAAKNNGLAYGNLRKLVAKGEVYAKPINERQKKITQQEMDRYLSSKPTIPTTSKTKYSLSQKN